MSTALPVNAYGPSRSCRDKRPEASEIGKVGSTAAGLHASNSQSTRISNHIYGIPQKQRLLSLGISETNKGRSTAPKVVWVQRLSCAPSQLRRHARPDAQLPTIMTPSGDAGRRNNRIALECKGVLFATRSRKSRKASRLEKLRRVSMP